MTIREAVKKGTATKTEKLHFVNHLSRAWDVRHTDKVFTRELLRRMKSWKTFGLGV